MNSSKVTHCAGRHQGFFGEELLFRYSQNRHPGRQSAQKRAKMITKTVHELQGFVQDRCTKHRTRKLRCLSLTYTSVKEYSGTLYVCAHPGTATCRCIVLTKKQEIEKKKGGGKTFRVCTGDTLIPSHLPVRQPRMKTHKKKNEL